MTRTQKHFLFDEALNVDSGGGDLAIEVMDTTFQCIVRITEQFCLRFEEKHSPAGTQAVREREAAEVA